MGLLQFQWLIYMRLRQQRVAAIGKEKLLSVSVENAHICDAALEVRYIVCGVLGIFAVAINLVLVLQQLGILHPVHFGVLLWGCDG